MQRNRLAERAVAGSYLWVRGGGLFRQTAREKIHPASGGPHVGTPTDATKKSAVVGKFNFALIFIG
jgi:hypothetical protein